MNCDLAFDLLTDPNGRGSQALDDHLKRCARCRQMQEVLSPALDAFEAAATETVEAGSTSGRDLLPGYWSTVATQQALDVALDAAGTLANRARPGVLARARWSLAALRYAAAACAGAALALALLPGKAPETNSRPVDALACRRHELAETKSAGRTKAEVQTLAASCARCHSADEAPGAANRAGTTQRSRRSALVASLGFDLDSLLRRGADSKMLPNRAAAALDACLIVATGRAEVPVARLSRRAAPTRPASDVRPGASAACLFAAAPASIPSIKPLDADLAEFDRVGMSGKTEVA